MAENTSAAPIAAIPGPADLQRAERFTREAFVLPGEDPAVTLAPGNPRRRALDLALRELDDGAAFPSTKWRRRWSLLLGLERVLSEDEPHLADDTLLNPHQVDALSGTLTALLAEAMRRAEANSNGGADGVVAAPVLAVGDDEDDVVEVDIEDEVVPEPDEPDDADEDDEEDDEDEDEESGEDLDIEIDIEELPDEAPDEALDYDDEPTDGHVDDDIEIEGAPEDPNAHKRFWFEHATGAGKTVAAMGFVEASRTGGVLILTHRRNLVDQFIGEITTRGYAKRLSPPLLDGEQPKVDKKEGGLVGPVTVETYQWFVRNAGRISDAYTIVICDEAHTALGDKTSATIRAWTGPVFIGMTATGADRPASPTSSRPDLAVRPGPGGAPRRDRSAALDPHPPAGVRTIAKVPLRRGRWTSSSTRSCWPSCWTSCPSTWHRRPLQVALQRRAGVVYTAGVRHAYNVAQAFRDIDIKAEAVSGETKKRELAEILARYEAGKIDVLVNAQLLAEGWNSPRATVCMHLAPTASKRIYQQRVGRVTRRHPGKEAGVVVDFVHPATRHDDPVVTLHSLLDRDVYRGGAIVVGPVRRGRGRRVRVERRVIPVCAEEERRHEVFERELWRIAVEHLDWGEQHMWSALAGARVQPNGWRRARAMLHFDKTGELKRRFLVTAVERNKNAQLRLRALAEIAASRDPEAFDQAHDVVGAWPRDERREGTKVLLQALAERRIGRRDQANAWIWRLAENTREIHEEYAVQRWPETKRLLGLLVNSSGQAHARNARRLVHASRSQDRRLQAAILAAAVGHTPEAESVLRDARTRLARKPSALSRELLRNFPKGRKRNRRRKRRGGEQGNGNGNGGKLQKALQNPPDQIAAAQAKGNGQDTGGDGETKPSRPSRRRRNAAARRAAAAAAEQHGTTQTTTKAGDGDEGSAAREPLRRESGGDAEPVRAQRPVAVSAEEPEAVKAAAPARVPAARKPAAKKPAARKPAAKPAAPKKPAAKKPAAHVRRRCTAAKKPAARRPGPRSPPPATVARSPAPPTRSPRRPGGARRRDVTKAPRCRIAGQAPLDLVAGRALSAQVGGDYPAGRPRWTSPACSAVCPPPGRSTTRRPAPSIPRATPVPPVQLTNCPARASRRRHSSSSALLCSASAASSWPMKSSRTSATSVGSTPLVAAVSCSTAGRSARSTATLRPTPTTAQPSCGRPSARIPATLRPSRWMSLGHLICASGPTVCATATAATSGSSSGGSRTSTDTSSALPGGADQVRPWRPRPADCSAAVTTVPCGAPPSASARARALVESVVRRCRCGVPIRRLTPGAPAPRRRPTARAGRRPSRG